MPGAAPGCSRASCSHRQGKHTLAPASMVGSRTALTHSSGLRFLPKAERCCLAVADMERRLHQSHGMQCEPVCLAAARLGSAVPGPEVNCGCAGGPQGGAGPAQGVGRRHDGLQEGAALHSFAAAQPQAQSASCLACSRLGPPAWPLHLPATCCMPSLPAVCCGSPMPAACAALLPRKGPLHAFLPSEGFTMSIRMSCCERRPCQRVGATTSRPQSGCARRASQAPTKRPVAPLPRAPSSPTSTLATSALAARCTSCAHEWTKNCLLPSRQSLQCSSNLRLRRIQPACYGRLPQVMQQHTCRHSSALLSTCCH